MKKAFKAFIELGIQATHSVVEQRRIKTVNLLNAVILLFLLIGLSHYLFIGNDYPLLPELVFMGLAAASIVCSYYKKTQYAFLLFTCNANLSIFFINQYYPFEVGSYLFYFPLIVSVILLNNVTSRSWMGFLHLGISALSFMLSLLLDLKAWQLQGLTQEAIQVMWYYNIVMAVVLTAMVSGILNRLIVVQNQEITAQNEGLSKAKEEIKASLKEKEVLLAELNHRVKNNLAIISGLLNLQLENSGNSETKQVINDSKNRILSMALVHRMLYNHPQLKEIDLRDYCKELIREVLNSFNLQNKVELRENYDSVCLPVNKSIPFGLILNEIVTNSIKYVFLNQNHHKHHFELSVSLVDADVVMVAKDSGKGFPRDFNEEQDGKSLGLFLIKTLAQQMDGQAVFSNEDGARVKLTFSLN
ncbi:MAG: sensor histidine kinase [Bacteroidia bacterium]|nr:sensor histidine kinase [Bacteroidia bacterium]